MLGLSHLNIGLLKGMREGGAQWLLWVRVCRFLWNIHSNTPIQGGESLTYNVLLQFVLVLLKNLRTVKNHS